MTIENTTTSLALVLEYFNAWRTKDFVKAGDLVANDAAFDTPINHYHNKNEFMEALKFTAKAASNIKLLSKFGNENDALLLYEMNLGSIGILTIAEHFETKDGKIVTIRHVHDTVSLREAGFEKNNSEE